MIIVVFGRFESCFAGVNDKIYVKMSVHETQALFVNTGSLNIDISIL